MTRRPPILLLAACAGLAAWACTRADLFGIKDEPSLPDKITFSGTVCSDNPLQRRFPVKVIFLMDVSSMGSTATGGAINQFRTQALSDIFNLYGGAAEISWSVVKYDGETASLTQDAYTRDVVELQQAATRVGLPCVGLDMTQCNRRRYELALERANNLITGDLLTTERGTRARTRYVIVLYSEGARVGPQATAPVDAGPNPDGAATPDPNTYYCQDSCLPPPGGFTTCPGFIRPCDDGCTFERTVREMRDFVVENGGSDLVVHTAHFMTGMPPATGASGGACCPMAPDDECQAQTVLARIAAAGGGTYLQYRSVGEVTFRTLEFAASKNVFIMKNLVAVNLNAKPTLQGHVPDSDADGLSDAEEVTRGLEPLRRDSDGDQLGDYLETILANLDVDPRRMDNPLTCMNLRPMMTGPYLDRDGDGLNDCEETLLGTDPTLFDTDADGYPDLIEMLYGTNYLTNDVNTDTDQDGARNGDELRSHSDPRSNDARTRGDLSYLYRVLVRDDGRGSGLSRLLDIQQPRAISGVTVKRVSPRAYPGVSYLDFRRGAATLAWRDNYGGPNFGPAVPIQGRGEYTLQAFDSVAGDADLERSITVEVIPELLPPRDLSETLQVRETERQCVDWRIRNITLVHTAQRGDVERLQTQVGQQAGDSVQEGLNTIFLYYGQTPLDAPLGPGLFRVATVPMIFIPPRTKSPDVAELNVLDSDFTLVGETSVTP